MNNWSQLIFSQEIPFEKKTQRVFSYQVENNVVYRRYCEALGISGQNDYGINEIPLLPIKAFKDAAVTSRPGEEPELTFQSSGTTTMQKSTHRVSDASLYDQSILRGFRRFYKQEKSVVLAYTPGYAENPNSSLIYMIQKLIDHDDSGLSRFLPLDKPLDTGLIKKVEQSGQQLILFGAAFGLLDLLERKETKLPSNSIIIETGGMKTHRREISRSKLHKLLAGGFHIDSSRIHSEYGMAELLSQAYATGGEWFRSVPWMQVSIRNPDDPFEILPPHSEGLVGIVDLANVHSCSFLLTGDQGVMDKNGRFKVLGRWNPKDLRGCNFLIEED